MRCGDCKWWDIKEEDAHQYSGLTHAWDTETYEMVGPAKCKHCCSPKLLFYETPSKGEACVVDGSQYMAALLTNADFGCVNFEEII